MPRCLFKKAPIGQSRADGIPTPKWPRFQTKESKPLACYIADISSSGVQKKNPKEEGKRRPPKRVKPVNVNSATTTAFYFRTTFPFKPITQVIPPLPPPSLSINTPTIGCPIPTREAGNSAATPLRVRVSMSGGDYLISGRTLLVCSLRYYKRIVSLSFVIRPRRDPQGPTRYRPCDAVGRGQCRAGKNKPAEISTLTYLLTRYLDRPIIPMSATGPHSGIAKRTVESGLYNSG
ncbi:hypothetical protein EVAR_43924_1 [Eumeta japonica]|uniref:Uncharacterized protein n=1 Tax=Eumeta variegata TaxID=151549 RepID=A0A4C1WP06_EUMVA|nr:hypothetical protein EVAR_43924_1 [Eumeta japonica]